MQQVYSYNPEARMGQVTLEISTAIAPSLHFQTFNIKTTLAVLATLDTQTARNKSLSFITKLTKWLF